MVWEEGVYGGGGGSVWCGRRERMVWEEKNKSGAKRASEADSHPGPQKKVIVMSKEDISEKKARPFNETYEVSIFR